MLTFLITEFTFEKQNPSLMYDKSKMHCNLWLVLKLSGKSPNKLFVFYANICLIY